MEVTAGLALFATTQIEQEEALLRLGCLWVDSAPAVHNINDRQSHTDHRVQKLIECLIVVPASGLDSLEVITVIQRKAMPGKLL